MKDEPFTPQTAADSIIASLEKRRDPQRIEGAQRFFKHPVSVYGIDAATLRRLARDWQNKLKPSWNLKSAVELCHLLIQKEELESKGVGILILSGFANQFDPDLLPVVKRWLERHADNWATVDTLSSSILSPLVGRHPQIIPEIMAWGDTPILWVRRAAVVTFVPLARHGKHLDAAYAIAENLLGNEEDLMHKAIGWLLREAGKQDANRLRAFLLSHGPNVPRTTVRYAIERFPKLEQKRLLEKTRKTKGN